VNPEGVEYETVGATHGMDEKSLHNPERVESSLHYTHLIFSPFRAEVSGFILKT
jgi:hypothetical protein